MHFEGSAKTINNEFITIIEYNYSLYIRLNLANKVATYYEIKILGVLFCST